MMKSITIILGKLLMIIILLTSCSDIEYKVDPYEAMSKGCEIHDFYIPELELQGKKVKDGYIAISTLRTYDVEPLKNQVPSFRISAASTIHPDPSTSQNFLDTVEYVVTSEAGTSKTWKIFHKYRDFTQAGIGEVDSLWFRSYADLNITNKDEENTVAVIGDMLVLSRTGRMYNRFTGEPVEAKLNFSGIDAGKNNPAQNIPFVLANDEAGNLLGCTLGAWSAPYFRVYKWNAATQPPVLVLDHNAKEETIEYGGASIQVKPEYGRKLIALGDVTKEGVIGSYNYKTNTNIAAHDFWGISGGQFNGKTYRVNTNYHANLYQLAYPVAMDQGVPFFYSDYKGGGTTLRYVWEEDGENRDVAILGPLLGHKEDKGNGWGLRVMHTLLFKFYNKQYLAVLHAVDKCYYLSIVDPGDNPKDGGSYKIIYTSPHKVDAPTSGTAASGNGNGTVGLTTTQWVDKDGVTRMNLYAFMTATGMLCYEFNNYIPEEE